MSVWFSNKLVAELCQPFWAALQAGEFLTDAACLAQTRRHRGLAWLREAGGVRPRRGRDVKGRYLSFAERVEIALGLARGESMRRLAVRLGRDVSTISREVARNRDPHGQYRASTAHTQACERASRLEAGETESSTWRCGSGWSRIWARSTRPSRSRAGCAPTSVTSRRCGCQPRRSTSRCRSSPGARCVGS